MYFRITHSLGDQFASRPQDLPQSVGSAAECGKFTFWVREVELAHQPKMRLCCDLTICKEPPPRVSETLHALAKNTLLLDQPVQNGIPYTVREGDIVDLSGNIKPGYSVPLKLLPRAAKPWLRDLLREMTEDLNAFIKCLRWHQASSGGHLASMHSSFSWSEDCETWSSIPRDFAVRVEQSEGMALSPQQLTEAFALIRTEELEPFGHELIREARQLTSSAPRSALLIACSALEIGVKSHVAYLVPNASLLVKKIPSPPVLTLIQEVLPFIFEEQGVEQSFFPVSGSDKDFIKKWISQRNQIAHGSKQNINSHELISFVQFVTSFLYKLDACRGNEWAVGHIEALTEEEI